MKSAVPVVELGFGGKYASAPAVENFKRNKITGDREMDVKLNEFLLGWKVILTMEMLTV